MASNRNKCFALFDEGKRPSDSELKSLDVKSRILYTYFEQWKRAQAWGNGSDTTTTIKPGDTTTTPPRGGIPTAPIAVGKITMTL